MTLILIIIEIIFLFMPLLYQVSSMPQWIVDVFSICLFISGVAIACYRAYADYNDKSGQLSSTKVQDRNEGSIKNDDKDVVNSSADMLSIEFQRKTKRKIDNMDDTRIQVVDKESSHESSFQGFTKIKLDQDNLSLTNRDLELKKFNGNYEKNKINGERVEWLDKVCLLVGYCKSPLNNKNTDYHFLVDVSLIRRVLPCKKICQYLWLIIQLSCLFSIIFCSFNLFVVYAFPAQLNKWYHKFW